MPITAPTIIWVLDTGTSGIAGSPVDAIALERVEDEKINNTSA